MSSSERPQLPPTSSAAESLRYEVNPAIALTLLSELHTQVSRYQLTLRRLVKRIHAVYAEGPVMAGWLASAVELAQVSEDSTHQALFRHGDADQLMGYLRRLETIEATPTPAECDAATQYYFCQLDAGGKIHTEPCPPPQVPVVSMAIARYQRLSLLVQQKRAIETKLQALIERLGPLRELIAEE